MVDGCGLVFWVLPFQTLRALAGYLEGGPEMFFISGISMVAAAVWTIMYNSDLLLKAISFVSGRFGKMRPVLVTAVEWLIVSPVPNAVAMITELSMMPTTMRTV